MKDAFDLMTDVRSLINISAVNSLIDGGIYPNDRPNNSGKIDLVINCNSISNSQDQIGYGNINGYVPELITPDGNGGQQFTPNYEKMASLCKAITPYVDTQFRDSFRTEVEDAGNIFQDTDGTWYFNIGFKYYSIQNNYQNI